MQPNLLKGRMAERGHNCTTLAPMLGKNRSYLYEHLKHVHTLHLYEVYELCEILDIPLEEIPKYFPKPGR